MFRVLFTVLVIAVSIAPSCFAATGHNGSGVSQLSPASKASLCDRLDNELGPKGISYARWSHC